LKDTRRDLKNRTREEALEGKRLKGEGRKENKAWEDRNGDRDVNNVKVIALYHKLRMRRDQRTELEKKRVKEKNTVG